MQGLQQPKTTENTLHLDAAAPMHGLQQRKAIESGLNLDSIARMHGLSLSLSLSQSKICQITKHLKKHLNST